MNKTDKIPRWYWLIAFGGTIMIFLPIILSELEAESEYENSSEYTGILYHAMFISGGITSAVVVARCRNTNAVYLQMTMTLIGSSFLYPPGQLTGLTFYVCIMINLLFAAVILMILYHTYNKEPYDGQQTTSQKHCDPNPR